MVHLSPLHGWTFYLPSLGNSDLSRLYTVPKMAGDTKLPPCSQQEQRIIFANVSVLPASPGYLYCLGSPTGFSELLLQITSTCLFFRGHAPVLLEQLYSGYKCLSPKGRAALPRTDGWGSMIAQHPQHGWDPPEVYLTLWSPSPRVKLNEAAGLYLKWPPGFFSHSLSCPFI